MRRVFIMDDAKQLMPAYLRFVRGIIDSTDLPLNVSREILQQSRDVQPIRAASVKRVLGLLDDLAKHQPDKYATFWNEFGRVLKEGVVEDAANRERIAEAPALRLDARRHRRADGLAGRLRRPDEGRAGRDLLLTADSYAAARNSPHLEIFRKLGVEVLLMYDRVDEWVVSTLTEFDGKPLQSVAKGDLDLSKLGGEAAKRRPAEGRPTAYRPLIERMQAALKDRASAVRLTQRLTDSPACLVSDEHGMSTNLERMLKASGPERADRETDAGDQPAPSDRRAAEAGDRRRPLRGLEPHPVRSGDARRRRSARRSGNVRQAPQLADADARRRRPVENLDAGLLSYRAPDPSTTVPASERRNATSDLFSSSVRCSGRSSGSRCGFARPPRS